MTKAIRLFVWGALLAGSACARAINYDDALGPRYAGVAPVTQGDTATRCEPDTIRVVTFNLKWARRLHSAVELFRAAAPLRGADVIMLQEMDASGTRFLANALGLSYIYYPATLHPHTKRDFGNAILSRWPIVADEKILLPHLGRGRRTRRAAVAATIALCDAPVRVYSVHLGTSIEIGPGSQRDQAAAVLADAQRYPRVIVAGDLNRHAVGAVFAAAGFAWPTRTQPKTTALFNIDHIFLRGVAPLAAGGTGVVRNTGGASDHRPVWALVELRAATPPPVRPPPPPASP